MRSLQDVGGPFTSDSLSTPTPGRNVMSATHATDEVKTTAPPDGSAAWIVVAVIAAVTVLGTILTYKEGYLGPLLAVAGLMGLVAWLALLVFAFTGSKRPVMFWKCLFAPLCLYGTVVLVFAIRLGEFLNPLIIGDLSTGEGGIGPVAVAIFAIVAIIGVIIGSIDLLVKLKAAKPAARRQVIITALILIAVIIAAWWLLDKAPLLAKLALILAPPILLITHLAKLLVRGRRDDYGVPRNKWAEKPTLYVALVAVVAALACIPLSGAILGLGY